MSTPHQARAVVTQVSPPRVRVVGSTSDVPAKALAGATLTVGAVVAVTVRNPLPPLVIGTES